MIEHVHKQIVSELRQNTRTDIVFILTAILLNLLILAINIHYAEESRGDESFLEVMFLFVTLLILLNLVVILGLLKGKQTRLKLLKGLYEMYKDQNVDKYYDKSLLSNYSMRYNLFIMVVVLTGLVSLIVPFVVR